MNGLPSLANTLPTTLPTLPSLTTLTSLPSLATLSSLPVPNPSSNVQSFQPVHDFKESKERPGEYVESIPLISPEGDQDEAEALLPIASASAPLLTSLPTALPAALNEVLPESEALPHASITALSEDDSIDGKGIGKYAHWRKSMDSINCYMKDVGDGVEPNLSYVYLSDLPRTWPVQLNGRVDRDEFLEWFKSYCEQDQRNKDIIKAHQGWAELKMGEFRDILKSRTEAYEERCAARKRAVEEQKRLKLEGNSPADIAARKKAAKQALRAQGGLSTRSGYQVMDLNGEFYMPIVTFMKRHGYGQHFYSISFELANLGGKKSTRQVCWLGHHDPTSWLNLPELMAAPEKRWILAHYFCKVHDLRKYSSLSSAYNGEFGGLTFGSASGSFIEPLSRLYLAGGDYSAKTLGVSKEPRLREWFNPLNPDAVVFKDAKVKYSEKDAQALVKFFHLEAFFDENFPFPTLYPRAKDWAFFAEEEALYIGSLELYREEKPKGAYEPAVAPKRKILWFRHECNKGMVAMHNKVQAAGLPGIKVLKGFDSDGEIVEQKFLPSNGAPYSAPASACAAVTIRHWSQDSVDVFDEKEDARSALLKKKKEKPELTSKEKRKRKKERKEKREAKRQRIKDDRERLNAATAAAPSVASG